MMSSESDLDEVLFQTHQFWTSCSIRHSSYFMCFICACNVLCCQGLEEWDETDSESHDSVPSNSDCSPIPDCEGIPRDGWSGKVLLARHIDGSDFAEAIIIASNPNSCIDGQSRFSEDDVGIVVLEVLNGDPSIGDTCLRWPMRQLFYDGQTGYVNIYDHARKREAIEKELERSRTRLGKRKYQYSRRSRAAALQDKRAKMLSWESIGAAWEESCCEDNCTRKFSPSTIRTLRSELHLQTYQVKSAKILDVHRTTHRVEGQRNVVTLEGIDICLRAWMLIHKVPRRTFDRYKAKAKSNMRAAPHGNLGTKKTRPPTIQAIETSRILLEGSADQMPHLTRTLPTGEKVGLKVLPTGMEWKQLLAIVNEVRFTLSWWPGHNIRWHQSTYVV